MKKVEELRVVQAGEILEKIQKGEPVEYENILLIGDLDISNLNLPKKGINRTKFELEMLKVSEELILIKPSIKIINSKINDEVRLRNTFFDLRIDFSGSQFCAKASFTGSHFNGDAYFTGSQFDEDASFWGSRFSGDADFGESQFKGVANLIGAQFSKYAKFIGAQFSRNADFIGSQFNGYADFRGSRFSGETYFSGSQFGVETYFNGSQFSGETSFSGSQFSKEASFWGSQFSEDADFSCSQFIGVANFMGSQFKEVANFTGSQFNIDTYFIETKFKDVDFSQSQFIGDALFESSSFENKIVLNRFRFKNFYVRWSSISNHLKPNDEVYLSLIENYKRLGWFEDADECYYSYRKNYSINDPIRRILDLGARLCFGYGIKPGRPLIWAMLIILLSGGFFYSANGIQKIATNESTSLGEALLFSATVFTSGVNTLISASNDLSPTGISVYVVLLERVLGWLFFALFLASLGKTIIR